MIAVKLIGFLALEFYNLILLYMFLLTFVKIVYFRQLSVRPYNNLE